MEPEIPVVIDSLKPGVALVLVCPVKLWVHQQALWLVTGKCIRGWVPPMRVHERIATSVKTTKVGSVVSE